MLGNEIHGSKDIPVSADDADDGAAWFATFSSSGISIDWPPSFSVNANAF